MSAGGNLVIRSLIVVLALAGLADAFYFTFAYYGRIKKARWIPEILCAREGSSCVTVLQTPYARVFGIPNSLLGISYYVLVIAWALLGPGLAMAWEGVRVLVPWVGWAFVAASAGTVALGFYLIYALRRKLHTDCPMCYTAHAINTALFILLIFANLSR